MNQRISTLLLLGIFVTAMSVQITYAQMSDSVENDTESLNGNQTMQNIEPMIYHYGRGILEFSQNYNPSCDISEPNVITIDPRKDELLNIDNKKNHFFVIIGNRIDDSYTYLEYELPRGNVGFPSYLLDMKDSNGERIRGGLVTSDDHFAVVLVASDTDAYVIEETYKKYLGGEGRNVFGPRMSIDPGKYELDAILFMSEEYNWIKNELCAAHVSWLVTVTDEGKIVSENPQIIVGSIKDVTEMYSPLKQSKIVNYGSIQCKSGLELVQKINGSPACVKPDSIPKLNERGWVGESEFVDIYALHTQEGEIFHIVYSIANAIVQDIVSDTESNSLIMTINSNGKEGTITITIPRGLIDARFGNPDQNDSPDDVFFVLVDGEEVEYREETFTDKDRRLTIDFIKDSKTVEIIGTNWT